MDAAIQQLYGKHTAFLFPKLNPTLCGTVLNSMNTINILPVSGATNYRLHVITELETNLLL